MAILYLSSHFSPSALHGSNDSVRARACMILQQRCITNTSPYGSLAIPARKRGNSGVGGPESTRFLSHGPNVATERYRCAIGYGRLALIPAAVKPAVLDELHVSRAVSRPGLPFGTESAYPALPVISSRRRLRR